MKVYSVMYTDTTDSDIGVYQKVSDVCSICRAKETAWKRVEEIFNSWMELLCFGPRRCDYRIISIDINPGLHEGIKIVFTKGLDLRTIIMSIKQHELEK